VRIVIGDRSCGGTALFVVIIIKSSALSRFSSEETWKCFAPEWRGRAPVDYRQHDSDDLSLAIINERARPRAPQLAQPKASARDETV